METTFYRISFLLILLPFLCFSQENLNYNALLVNNDLKEDANSVIRKNDIILNIQEIDKMSYREHRIVTVLNKSGNSDINAQVYYNTTTQIKKLEARVYNQFGEVIKKYKSRDFNDESAVSGGTLYSDDRVKFLDYTPSNYPYTVEFIVETSTKNTAGLPKWYPIEGYYVSTEESKITVFYNENIGLHKKEVNFDGYSIQNNSVNGKLEYVANNISAISYESYSPVFREFAPVLKIAANKFYYEGYSGENSDWESLGKWMYNELIATRLYLPLETKTEISNLTSQAQTDKEKAKIVYEYVQDKTRYISVQEGIGGIQPIEAKQVDKVKYGDCKGLTNYTKALLDVVGVEANYTRVYASSRNTIDIDKDFVSFVGQTNHVILNIPQENDEDIWLECTSQTSPFNYSANFTDDRKVFVLSPTGGKIVHTKVYSKEENLQKTEAKVLLTSSGGFTSQVKIQSQGTQYGYHEGIQNNTKKDQELYYKEYWDYLNNIEIVSMRFKNNKDDIVFSEDVEIQIPNYASSTSGLLLLEPNMFNRMSSTPPRYRDRKLPFEVERGFTDVDEYEILLPDNLEVDTLQESVDIINRFGEYHVSITEIAPNKLIYKRSFILNKGKYNSEEYNAFRDFRLKVVRLDKSKIVLKEKQ